MSDNDIKPVLVQPEQKRKRLPFFWGNTGILFSGAATGILIAVILVASYALLTVNHQVVIALTNLTGRFTQSERLMIEVENKAVTAQKEVDELNAALKTQSQSILELQKNQRVNRDDILLADIFSRIKMANDSLQYENNVPTAIKWLRSANQQMATLTDSRLYPVRKALAADEIALQGAAMVDVSGVYARLAALGEELDKLPWGPSRTNAHSALTIDGNQQQLPWWRRGLNSLRLALERIVVVRRNVPAAPPFIAPDQQLFLYQNLHAELATAEWALLHRQPVIYQLSLQQTIDWIKNGATPDSPVTKQFLQTLTELQSVNVRPVVPALTASLQALQTYMNHSGN